ncbi:MAG: transketolase [Burkholderiales bacterium]|nr:transketolase [Burkholderiales bacterium]
MSAQSADRDESPPPPERLAQAIRMLTVDAIVQAGEGHQGAPLGLAEVATVLYTRFLRFDAADPTWFDRDRVVLSNGHGSMLLYALLHLTGYEAFPIEQLKRFRELGSHCEGHPERDVAHGIEVTTGPLGQGIANALGMAVAEAWLNARFGPDLVNHRTWAFVGDGCLQEGVGQEMIQLAGHWRLGKLTLLWDDNAITDDGPTSLAISEDVVERFRVAGWHTVRVDGHDCAAIEAAIASVYEDPRPSLIACRTVIAKGLARLQGTRAGHSGKILPQDVVRMRKDLDWPHPPFDVPPAIAAAWRAAGARGQPERMRWQARVAALPEAQRSEFERVIRGGVPKEAFEELLRYKREALLREPLKSGIFISAEISERLAQVMPEWMVACADLEGPMDHKRSLNAFSAEDRSGRYLHCGVREHAMAALAVGMAAHGGIVPLALTYLAFSDYARPAMRMAALMGLPVKFVFSHDSIGIGRNGPTHQPVETLASLRAMPKMLVLRPADAVEAAECWAVALAYTEGPSCLVFARQMLPHVRREAGEENRCAMGAYVLEEAQVGERRVTLLATGSEVALALKARQLLEDAGIGTAVVSMPCWELFVQQPNEVQRAILGDGTVRVACEAAVEFGWSRWLGARGAFLGMRGFGASGAPEALYQHFGITVEAIVEAARRLLAAEE